MTVAARRAALMAVLSMGCIEASDKMNATAARGNGRALRTSMNENNKERGGAEAVKIATYFRPAHAAHKLFNRSDRAMALF